MESASQLNSKLKSLRLSGILETLEVRNKQAVEERCSYVEFLEKLLEDEMERRGQKQLDLRLRRSRLEMNKTLSAFDFSFNPSVNRGQVFDLATCGYVHSGESVFLMGPTGVGKTHLAQALGHEAARRGFDVLHLKASEMLGHLQAGRGDGSYERRLAAYVNVDVLILDDFGLKPMRPPMPEDLYEVIDGRYGHRPFILTTNRAFDEWPELFDNPVLASAALDRLAHGATQIVLTGDSYRAKGPSRAASVTASTKS
ncbi:MAG: IS21-like element helper ATPase IstB [bacterium]